MLPITESADLITSVRNLSTSSQSLQEDLLQLDLRCDQVFQVAEKIRDLIESERRNLALKISGLNFSAGDSINYVTLFFKTLSCSEDFRNFTKIKNQLSELDGLIVDFTEKLSEDHIICHSKILSFSETYKHLSDEIEKKIQQQIQILKIQVHYAVNGDSLKIQEKIKNLIYLLQKNHQESLKFIKDQDVFKVKVGVTHKLGGLFINKFSDETDVINNPVGDQLDDMNILQSLKISEETTVKEVIENLTLKLNEGIVDLKNYKLSKGLVEFMILANVDFFCDHIEGVPSSDKIDLTIEVGDKKITIDSICNITYRPKQERI